MTRVKQSNALDIETELSDNSEVAKTLEKFATAATRDWPEDEQSQAKAALVRYVRASTRLMTAHKQTLVKSDVTTVRAGKDDSQFVADLVADLLAPDPYVSPQAIVALQGAQRYRRLLDEAGGTYSKSEVAQLIGISEAGVTKRLKRGALFAVEVGGHARYPVWQFNLETGEVYADFLDVLNLLETGSTAAKARFFLTPNEALHGRPIDAIHEGRDIALVKREALSFDQHGAD